MLTIDPKSQRMPAKKKTSRPSAPDAPSEIAPRDAAAALRDAARAAALDVLYQHNGPLDPAVLAAVEGLAKSDGNPDVCSAAASVLDKQQMYHTVLLSDGK